MMVAPLRVALFLRATLAIKEPGQANYFPCARYPVLGVRGSAEQQLDHSIRNLAQTQRNVSLRVEVETDRGEAFTADFDVQRGRFDNTRRSMAEAYIARAHAASTLEQARTFQAQAQLLDGRARSDMDLPTHLRLTPATLPPMGIYVPRLARASHKHHATGFCAGCGLRVPRLRGFQDGEPVVVLQLHRGKIGKAEARLLSDVSLCKASARDWAWLDARLLYRFDLAPAEIPPVMADRVLWMEMHLGMVPPECGGPMLDQLPALLAAYHRQTQGSPA